MDKKSIAEIVTNEFSRSYRVDEFPLHNDDVLRGFAETSAAEMAHEAGARRADLLALLRDLRADRAHPLHERISLGSEMDWYTYDDDFAVFQRLVGWMLEALES